MVILGGMVLAGCGNRRIGLGLGQELSYTYAAVYAPDGRVVHSAESEKAGHVASFYSFVQCYDFDSEKQII
jgi:hypothetical protein